jgi:hypothetical protein
MNPSAIPLCLALQMGQNDFLEPFLIFSCCNSEALQIMLRLQIVKHYIINIRIKILQI